MSDKSARAEEHGGHADEHGEHAEEHGWHGEERGEHAEEHVGHAEEHGGHGEERGERTEGTGEHGVRETSSGDGGLPRAAGRQGLLRPRLNRGQLIVAVLCAVLGFAVAAQVRSNDKDTKFATARQDELVGILGDLSQRSDRLRSDIRDLDATKSGLEHDAQGQAAIEDARRRATTYGILAGTLPATGPGIELTIDDPQGRVRAASLLDTLEELRDAGAEVVQVGDVRVGVSTYFTDPPGGGGVTADGHLLTPPYRFLVIGDPHTLATAMNIPGGVLRTLHNSGADGVVAQREKITVQAVRSP
jgi:uncharacterized protein YlxW (UPF0749 family)